MLIYNIVANFTISFKKGLTICIHEIFLTMLPQTNAKFNEQNARVYE